MDTLPNGAAMPLSPLLPSLLVCASLGAVSIPDGTVPLSAGMQLKARDCTPGELQRIRDLGLTWVRRGFIWGEVEKTVGSYDFTAYDALLAECEARGLTLLGCIALNNKLYPHVRTPEGRAGYARFAAACAERYKGRAVMWELWNEPNVRTFWGKHGTANTPDFAHEYAALVNAAAPAMRAVAPDCVIAAGSVSCLGWEAVNPWMETCFKDGVLQSGISVWSVHPYSLKRPEDYGRAYTDLRALMARYTDKPVAIMNSERGYPTTKAEGWAGGEGDLQQFQAWHFTRQYLNDLMHDVRLTSWYEWSGDEGFAMVPGGKPSKAHAACQVMLAQLDGYRFAERLPMAGAEDYVLRFTRAAGGTKLVAWTAPKPGETPEQAVEHDVSVPVAGQGACTAVSLDNVSTSLPVRDGAITIRLSPGPQYIALP
jgi:hypothetical protein